MNDDTREVFGYAVEDSTINADGTHTVKIRRDCSCRRAYNRMGRLVATTSSGCPIHDQRARLLSLAEERQLQATIDAIDVKLPASIEHIECTVKIEGEACGTCGTRAVVARRCGFCGARG